MTTPRHPGHRDTPRYQGQQEEAPDRKPMRWQVKALIVVVVVFILLIIAQHAFHIKI
jgi:hypothetical protein